MGTVAILSLHHRRLLQVEKPKLQRTPQSLSSTSDSFASHTTTSSDVQALARELSSSDDSLFDEMPEIRSNSFHESQKSVRETF
eukprot:TRINITY_DN15978_c0_g1_i1.p1 TRINITY_DN15978_c0_g1~~TRINITY_DN15978_c0_g1_i1.p1  ORF type:complete len:84 (-),score=8.65 TRINITY_DN15978_c0_g1_i1:31-282(-)